LKGNNQTCKAFILDSVSFSYRGSNSAVLNDMTLECHEGEWLVIVGRNGSGKSTLLKFLSALLIPERGVCRVFGLDTSLPENVAEIRSLVAMVFQNPENQIVGVTVEDDAAFALENQYIPTDEIERRVAFSIGKAGLLEKRKSSVHSLSGGEKQRLALAGAIAQGAKMFLLDEATSMLDSYGRDDILSLFMELHSEGHTIVQVTHNIEEVRFADRIVIIDNGRHIWSGGRKEFFMSAESFGFDLPALAEFARKIGAEDIADYKETRNKALDLPRDDERIRQIKGLFETTPSLRATPPWRGITPSLRNTPPQRGIIEVRNLSHVYSDGVSDRIALDNVSFCIERGELVTLTGRTGSGKSTLIQYLNALYTINDSETHRGRTPGEPVIGEVLIDGQNININPREARRKIGMVFQFPEHQLFAQTVREELGFALKNWGISDSEHEERILEAVKQSGITESMIERSPFSLSGGEMRAVCIASALVTKPDWLILDEPVAGLDSRAKRELLSLLNELKSSGVGILTVTHDLEFALLNSDRILVLQEGKLVCDAVPEAAAQFLYESRALKLPDIVNLWRELR